MLEIREVEDLQIPDVKAFEHLIKSKITKPDYLFYQLFACFYLHRKKKEAEAENDFLEQLLILILLFEIELALFSNKEMIEPVSYTHLTLPTTVGPCRSRWSPYH